MSLLLFSCLSMIVPMGAVLSGLLYKGKGHPAAATWAWWSAGLLMLSPFALLFTGVLSAVLSVEGPVVAGAILSLVLQFAGNVCGALAASPDDARPAAAYVLILTAFALPAFPVIDRMAQVGVAPLPIVDDYLVPVYFLVALPLGILWFSGGGVAMALGRAFVVPRLFEDGPDAR